MNKRILLLEDNMDISRKLTSCLQDSTTDVEYLLSVNDALDSLFRCRYCLIILSLELIGVESLSFLQLLRRHHAIPILAVSENVDTSVKIAALQYGADGFMAKPFDEGECVALVQALIRRYIELGGDLEKPYALCANGTLIVDPQYRCVTFKDTPVELSRKEFDLLYFLMLHQRQVFSHSQLYERIWREDGLYDFEKTIRFHIQSLRKNLLPPLAFLTLKLFGELDTDSTHNLHNRTLNEQKASIQSKQILALFFDIPIKNLSLF